MNDNLLDNSNPPQEDPNKNYLAEFVGEGKKFKDAETLAKAKYDSDQYIKTLERQKDELRADYLKIREESMSQAKLKELIDQLEAKQKSSAITPNAPDQDVQKPQSFDPKELESLVSKSIQAHEMTKTQEQNFNFVKNKLIEKHGSNYQAALKQQIDSLGLTEDYVNEMARKYPSAFLKTLGVDAQPGNSTFQSPPKSATRNDSFTPQVQQDRTWAWYQNLKKTDPKTYLDPKTSVQMHNDAIRLGERFKDGDYAAFD